MAATQGMNQAGSQDEEKKFTCDGCGDAFKFRGELTSHRRLLCGRTGDHSCPFCSYRCKMTNHLSQHIRYKHNHQVLVSTGNQCSLAVKPGKINSATTVTRQPCINKSGSPLKQTAVLSAQFPGHQFHTSVVQVHSKSAVHQSNQQQVVMRSVPAALNQQHMQTQSHEQQQHLHVRHADCGQTDAAAGPE